MKSTNLDRVKDSQPNTGGWPSGKDSGVSDLPIWNYASPIGTILRLPQVSRKTGMARSSIYAAIAKNLFPRQIKLSVRCVGWLESDIDAWVSERISAMKGNSHE